VGISSIRLRIIRDWEHGNGAPQEGLCSMESGNLRAHLYKRYYGTARVSLALPRGFQDMDQSQSSTYKAGLSIHSADCLP
jgi:hypothetical protein